MSNSNGIITAPVSIADVQKVLGVADNNIGALCKSSKVRMLSISKPTNKDGLFLDDWQEDKNTDNWYAGIEHYGISKPYVVIPTSLYPSSPSGPKVIKYDFSTLYNQSWSHIPPTVYRLPDFNGYDHNQIKYPVSRSIMPIIASSFTLIQTGSSGLSASYIAQYDFNDNIAGSSKTGSLGVGNLFNAVSNNVYFGIVIYAHTSAKRTTPLAVMTITSKRLGVTDSETGHEGVAAIDSSTVGNMVGGSSTNVSTEKFYPQEEVYVIPFLARYHNSMWKCMGLRALGVDNYQKLKIGNVIITGGRAYVTSATIKVTWMKNGDGTFTFYLAQQMDFNVKTAGGNYITFIGTFGIGAGGSDVYVVSANNASYAGTADEDVAGGTKVYTSGSIFPLSGSMSAAPANRPGSITIKPYSSVTSVNVFLIFSYWYETQRYRKASFTANLSLTTGTNSGTLNMTE